ncbi:hypothetical protein N0V88_003789 [Collariella sp. IMI 366227]|nr:hypothetical protein N0V88_003789 [Collariella sp. IMI 366227]
MKDKTPIIELDGRTGEGGGQLVRIASALAAITTTPLRITNVRGNREGPRGGGLKSQHVTALDYLATATGAEVEGLAVGSHTLEFRPQLRPSQLKSRTIKISADSPAASTMLIFQAVFPFLLFAANDKNEPIALEISGGTNVSFSLSYEYMDQVFLPTLEDAFGIKIERKLFGRGWSLGKQQRGRVEFKFKPIKLGETIKMKAKGGVYGVEESGRPNVEDVEAIDVSIIIPSAMHDEMTEALVEDLEQLFPDAEINFKVMQDSGADSRINVLLVAKAGVMRWGRDVLMSVPKKAKGQQGRHANYQLPISKELYEEVSTGAVVDEFLQDQLVIFQALADGQTSFPRGDDKDSLDQAMAKIEIDGDSLRKEKADKPFGEGSTHTATARWVTAQLLPAVSWYNKGYVCDGVGMHMEKTR